MKFLSEHGVKRFLIDLFFLFIILVLFFFGWAGKDADASRALIPLMISLIFSSVVASTTSSYLILSATPETEIQTMMSDFAMLDEIAKSSKIKQRHVEKAIQKAKSWIFSQFDHEEKRWGLFSPVYETAVVLNTLYKLKYPINYEWGYTLADGTTIKYTLNEVAQWLIENFDESAAYSDNLMLTILKTFYLYDVEAFEQYESTYNEILNKTLKMSEMELSAQMSQFIVEKREESTPPIFELVEIEFLRGRYPFMSKIVNKVAHTLEFVEKKSFSRFLSNQTLVVNPEMIARGLYSLYLLGQKTSVDDQLILSLKNTQNTDGSWNGDFISTAYVVAMFSKALRRELYLLRKGLIYLLANQDEDGSWDSDLITTCIVTNALQDVVNSKKLA